MGYVQFESIEHGNKVADSLGLDRPYSSCLGDDADGSALVQVTTALSMAKSLSDITGDKLTTAQLLALSGLSK